MTPWTATPCTPLVIVSMEQYSSKNSLVSRLSSIKIIEKLIKNLLSSNNSSNIVVKCISFKMRQNVMNCSHFNLILKVYNQPSRAVKQFQL